MKFDQDLRQNLWYELNPRVRCAFGNVSFYLFSAFCFLFYSFPTPCSISLFCSKQRHFPQECILPWTARLWSATTGCSLWSTFYTFHSFIAYYWSPFIRLLLHLFFLHGSEQQTQALDCVCRLTHTWKLYKIFVSVLTIWSLTWKICTQFWNQTLNNSVVVRRLIEQWGFPTGNRRLLE